MPLLLSRITLNLEKSVCGYCVPQPASHVILHTRPWASAALLLPVSWGSRLHFSLQIISLPRAGTGGGICCDDRIYLYSPVTSKFPLYCRRLCIGDFCLRFCRTYQESNAMSSRDTLRDSIRQSHSLHYGVFYEPF